MIIAVIVACEIAFWVLLAIGLTLRYPLRSPRAGLVTLALVPLVDIVLLIATALNLRLGATATVAHSLAAFYLGFSLAYGHRLMKWADVRFAHRFANGPPPKKLFGWQHTRLCWHDVARTALAVGIASGITWALIAWANEPARTAALESTYRWSVLIIGVEILFAVSYTIWPRKAPATAH